MKKVKRSLKCSLIHLSLIYWQGQLCSGQKTLDHVEVIYSIFSLTSPLLLRNSTGQNSKREGATPHRPPFRIVQRSFIVHLPAYYVLNRLLYLWVNSL